MATWLVHLRVAEKILEEHKELDEEKFILGNIATDSGMVVESGYVPNKIISHFWVDEVTDKKPHPELFYDKYLFNKQYDNETYSFYMGYYTHLLTDKHWKEDVVNEKIEKYQHEFVSRNEMWRGFKKDWYDLDFLYMKQHSCFRAWKVYKGITDLKNVYVEEFPKQAFEIKHNEIVEFYSQKVDNLDRQYRYLTKEEMNRFVDKAVDKLLIEIKTNIRVIK